MLAPAASPACEPTDGFDLHPDVVALAVLLVAGENEARMLAVHPHRQPGDAAPQIAATLEGPGWKAAFSRTLELEACGGLLPGPAPSICLGATPPEAIGPGVGYGIRGTAPLGGFTGEMRFPVPPLLVEPADTLRLSWRDVRFRTLSVPIRYQVPADVGTLLAHLYDFAGEIPLPDHYLPVDRGARWGTLTVYPVDVVPVRFSLRLLGIGRHYTDFVKHIGAGHPLPRPWPSFGIEGEGVYGYFDGITPSRAARILVESR
ncbi:MAG: hypothetical protein OXU64_01685 [Gemmatimonadota bacterium]|nr:hypothetical protein [Gemmatimonadota bacterium]